MKILKNRSHSILSTLLTICILASLCTTVAMATEQEEYIRPFYVNIMAVSSSLSINSYGMATCEGYADSAIRTDKIDMTMTLQESIGGAWVPIKNLNTLYTWYQSMSQSFFFLYKGS